MAGGGGGSGGGEIYSATYSNVPVYELKVGGGDHIMRRRSDDWINATHILKIAGFDKPARTRILERDVQRGVHEKIQGGYGKYQGTWVPLSEGRLLAERNNIFDKISHIFDYVPGDRSPPPAPKHTTAASARPKPTKASAAHVTKRTAVPPGPKGERSQGPRRKTESVMPTAYHAPPEPAAAYEEENSQYPEDEAPARATPETASFMAEEEYIPLSQASNASRKRKREADEAALRASDLEHTMYGDELLDYFVTAGDDAGGATSVYPPLPPPNFDVNRPIDSHGNNALHWACAMGDVAVTKDLLGRGANPAAENMVSGETPLMRAVLFTNNYDKQTFPKLVNLLAATITERDRHGATVFHHIAETARTKSKWSCARYYCEVLINKMSEMGYNFVQAVLQSTDGNGDTAVLCAIRNGCIKVASFLLNHCPEAGDIRNIHDENANDLLRILREKRESLEQPASSPPRAGDPFSSGTVRKRSSRRPPSQRQPVSRAASHVLSKVGPLMESASTKLANMYDADMKEKDMAIAEAKATLSDFENQRHSIRQKAFALQARAETEGFADDGHAESAAIVGLRHDLEVYTNEVESLLEQKEHASLQKTVLAQDQLTPPNAFRSANNHQPLSGDEIRQTLPLAVALLREQTRRRSLVHDIARSLAEAGTGERVGKHRKLVAIATGLKEDELDMMSKELLDSLEASKASPMMHVGVASSTAGPSTPPPRVTGRVA